MRWHRRSTGWLSLRRVVAEQVLWNDKIRTPAEAQRANLECRSPRTRCARLHLAARHPPFCSGAASRADGSGPRSPPHPRSERGGVPLQNATPRSGHAQGLANGFLEGLRAWKPASPGNSHGQGCPWHLAGACPCARSGARTAREGGENRGFVDSASARRCIRLFVAARLPAPTGAGKNCGLGIADFGLGVWRRGIRLFVAARLPAPIGSGPRSPPHPRSERGGVPLQNAARAKPSSDV